MKKRKILIMILLCIFALNINAKAESMAQFLKCPEEVVKGEVFSCDIYVNTSNSDPVTKIMGSITQNAIILLDHYEKGQYITNEKIVYHNFTFTSNDGVPNGETILKVYVKVAEDTNYKEGNLQLFINEIKLKNSGSISNIDLKSEKIIFKDNPNPKSSENRLSGLSVSDGTLSPNFNSDTLEYTLTTDKEEITITPALIDTKGSVVVSNTTNNIVKLQPGKNNIEITVEAENGAKKVYKLVVTRNTNNAHTIIRKGDENTKLQLLSVDGEKIELKDDNYNYTINVPYETSKANLLYSAADSTSTVTVSGDENLKVGENSIIIRVKAPNGVTSKYYLTIIRANEIKSNDTSIKKLEVLNATEFNFNSDNHNYVIELPKKVDKLKLNIELTDSTSKYEITGNENLKNNSKVVIKVEAQDGSSTTYTILIEKKENNNLMVVLIALIAILVAIIIGIIIIANNKKNKNNNKLGKSKLIEESKIELDNPEFEESDTNS